MSGKGNGSRSYIGRKKELSPRHRKGTAGTLGCVGGSLLLLIWAEFRMLSLPCI